MGLDVGSADVVSSMECITCGQCVTVCPSSKPEINMTVFGRAIKPMAFMFVTAAVFFGSIAALNAAGLMQVTVPTVEAVAQSGNYLKVADLRGSMSIEMGAVYTGMELSEFYKLMEIPEDVPKDTQMKYIFEFVPGYDFHAVKARK